MDPNPGTPHHRKRKRRRAPDRSAIAAQLIFDPKVQGDIAHISEDLFYDLFPTSHLTGLKTNGSLHNEDAAQPLHVAIQPQIPGSSARPDSGSWTIVRVKLAAESSSHKPNLRSTLRLSSSTSVLRHFFSARLQNFLRSPPVASHTPIDINILDVLPIPLDTVVVYIDETVLGKEGEFKKLRRSEQNDYQQETWVKAVRYALGLNRVVRSGDVLALVGKTGGVSEGSITSAVVEFCEPVSQGLLAEHTKVVVVPDVRRKVTASRVPRASLSYGILEDHEDTSSEQFYSATEEQGASPAQSRQLTGSQRYKTPQRKKSDSSSSKDSSDAAETDLSDSESEAVGLSLPSLPGQALNILSDFGSTTSRDGTSTMNGTSSPASVISGYSSTTIRAGRERAKVFSTFEVATRIPDVDLHPKPASDEDEEARVFTDTTSLSKLGCFSGDWVKIESSMDRMSDDNSSLVRGLLSSTHEVGQDWRVVKIYALPSGTSHRPKYAIDKTGRQLSSASCVENEKNNSPLLFMPPLLLANIGSPASVRVSVLDHQSLQGTRKSEASKHGVMTAQPPFAKEVDFHILTTPLATERTMHPCLMQGLKKYLSIKNRVVKSGDLIAIPIDDNLGHAIYQSSGGHEVAEQEEIFMKDDQSAENFGNSITKVAWFKVGPFTTDFTGKEAPEVSEGAIWGGTVTVRPGFTKLVSNKNAYGRIPSTLSSKWPYYIGTKRLPASLHRNISDQTSRTGNSTSYVSHTRRRLRELLSVATSPQAVHFKMPPIAVLLTSTQKHIGKATAATNACADLGLHIFTIDAFDILSEGGVSGGDVKTAGFLESRAERAMTCGAQYTALLIKHIDALTGDRMVGTLQHILTICRVLLATTTDLDKVHESVRGLFVHELQVSAPDEKEREGLLQDIVQTSGVSTASDVNMSAVALKTAALVAGDLVDVVDRAVVARDERLEKLAIASTSKQMSAGLEVNVRDLQLAGGDTSRCIVKADFDIAVDAARKNFADAIGAPKIPNVTWDDVGGLSNVKDAVMETIQLPLERPELFAKGMKKRSGILFYGPPGTGKTLLAKAIATEFSLNFFSVKGPEMLNMYIGESEANVRRVFQRARDARPCVVFFDELDSVAPRRGKSGDSQGVMDRIVSQLLAELDGMSDGEGGGVFVIGATNRPDLLDQALLRPGRFDKMLYLGVSDTHEKQLTILEALTRKFTLHPSLSLSSVASALSFTYTGADLYALCSDAMLKAITHRATSVDNKIRDINAKRAASTPPLPPITVAYFFDHLADSTDTEVVVGLEDFQSAIRELVPSVSVKELEHYNRVRQEFEKGEENKGPRDRPDVTGAVGTMGDGENWGNGRSGVNHEMEEDDLVLRTGGMTLEDTNGVDGVNGDFGDDSGKGRGRGKGKGKGKQVNPPEEYGFGDAAEGDEDMYNS